MNRVATTLSLITLTYDLLSAKNPPLLRGAAGAVVVCGRGDYLPARGDGTL